VETGPKDSITAQTVKVLTATGLRFNWDEELAGVAAVEATGTPLPDATVGQRSHPAGRPTHVLPRWQLVAGILFHYTLSLAGTLGQHLGILFSIDMAESSLSERRQALPFEFFEELLKRVLRPIAKMKNKGQAYYRQWRLVAIDGLSFSLPNNKSIQQRLRKGGNQHGPAGSPNSTAQALVGDAQLCSGPGPNGNRSGNWRND
jgi:hypothetical protein